MQIRRRRPAARSVKSMGRNISFRVSSFRFFDAAVLAQEIVNFGMFRRKIERPITGTIFRVHLRAIGHQQFDHRQMTIARGKMQGRPSGAVRRGVHLRAVGDELFGGNGIAGLGGLVERFGVVDEGTDDHVLNARGNAGATGKQRSGQNKQ